MARFDPKLEEIVLRIVYDGPATAGKSTSLRAIEAAYATRARGELFVPEETATGRTLFFDWLELSAGTLDDWPLRVEIVSVPGQLALAERRYRLLRAADAAVFVCDSTPSGMRAAQVAWAFLVRAMRDASLPVVLQANKQDVPGAPDPEEVARRVGFVGAAVIGASALDGEGVRLTLYRAIDLARGRLRASLGAASPRTLPIVTERAADLYAAMKDPDEGDPDFHGALETALEQVKET